MPRFDPEIARAGVPLSAFRRTLAIPAGFLLAGQAIAGRRAQEARLGYGTLRRSIRSRGVLAATFFGRLPAWARRLEIGLAARGFEGELKVLTPRRDLSPTRMAAAGALRLDGRPAAYDRRALADWRGRVGLVLQEPDDQLFSATVYQDVSFGPLNQGLSPSWAHVRVMDALSAMDISHLAERPTHLLSFGQKKRAAIAGVLAMGPELLILDEPDAGLDGQGVVQLRLALDALQAQGATLVFATHDVDLAYAWADEVAILVEGRLLRQGEPSKILGDPDLLAAAGLAIPVLLQLARALCRTQSWPDGRAPRTAEALIAMLSDAAATERLRA